MSIGLKATLLAVALLVIGAVIGATGQHLLADRHQAEVDRLRRAGGFVEHMRDLVQPRDSAQWERLLPLITAADQHNRLVVDDANAQMRASMDSLLAVIRPLLDADQWRRVEEFSRRPPPGDGPPGLQGGGERGGGPGGRGPPPGGPPEPGMRPPPGGRP